MNPPLLDERETSVAMTGDRLAWLVTAFGLLGIVAWRSFVDGVASWELLVLVVLGGAVSFGYRLWNRSVPRAAFVPILVALLAAVVLALAIVVVLDRMG